MRPNLSLESITAALAVLGTGVIMAACGGEEPKTPVNANEVSGASDKAGEGAGHCGATKDHKPGEASCSADKKGATDPAKPADPAAATPATTTPAAATPADAHPAAAADPKAAAPAATGTGAAKKPAAPAPAGAPAKKGGSGSCGAGTCSAKK